MFVFIRNFMVFMLFISLSACSVVMATRNNGDDPKQISQCKTRTCLLAAGLVPLEQKKNKNGKIYFENLRGALPTGSASRAFMHALLDLSTIGIWEAIGTPIEANKAKKTSYIISVDYAPDGETIKHMIFKF